MLFTTLKPYVAAALAAAALATVAPSAASAAGSINGIVTVQDTGAPLPGFEVELYSAAGTLLTTACSDVGGAYQFAGVAAGGYTVRFAGDDILCGGPHPYAPEWFNGRFSRALADTVTVTDGADTANVDASLQDGARVTGTVTDAASGRALAHTTAQLLDVTGTVVMLACSGAAGTYSLFPVPPGVYAVRFISPGQCGNAGDYLPQWYDNSSTQQGAAAIGLVAGEQRGAVNARLISGTPATLTVAASGPGFVSGAAGISCPGTCVGTYPKGSTVTLTATPVSGATFSGWSGGGCAGIGACVLTLGGDRTVTATFTPATTPPAGDPGTSTPQPGPGAGGTGNPGGGSTTTPPPPARLNAKIVKAKFDTRRGTARFTLSATGGVAPLRLECSLVKKGAKAKFKRCRATASYKRIKKGKYVFAVRVRDARGQTDTTPATRRFSSRRR